MCVDHVGGIQAIQRLYICLISLQTSKKGRELYSKGGKAGARRNYADEFQSVSRSILEGLYVSIYKVRKRCEGAYQLSRASP
jgi:hypothetical protein